MSSQRYFVFIYPKKSEINSLLNLAIFSLHPQEKWPAHITVAGPFERRPTSRAQPRFDRTVFSLGAWNFFQQGISTVYLKVGMNDIWRYWNKPSFIGNPVPHISLYNGQDEEFAQKIFNKLHEIRPIFAFDVEGIEVINSSAQSRMDLRSVVDVNTLPHTRGMQLDEIASLPKAERLEIASEALLKCRPSEMSAGAPLMP
ncbi:MAG: 2'-5' RNA ligase family protein [Erythrobacter sp.]|nr:2'-5' RNA ligase family protein [Erythrobacter sp.]MDZ4272532.1 2'-5' RNA ligase family protein [Erythrobacter sp.]